MGEFNEHYSEINFDANQITTFLKEYGGNTLSHLFFLKDKDIFWAADKQALIVYKRIANKLIVLGDPIGRENVLETAMDEFHSFCKSQGLKPIYYQVNPSLLPLYAQAGYKFFKLGEEAKLSLADFNIAGKKGLKLRNRLHKFQRLGFKFEVLTPPFSPQLLSQLAQVSESWLGKRKEQCFSVGFFSKCYVSRSPVALLYNPDGQIVAFATLACNNRKVNRTMTVDLMRHLKNCPHGTMDVLFISIFFWAKEQGYKWCNLGMSPLANVGTSKKSPWSEKMGRLVFEHGNYFYKFKGLRDYKSKYTTHWEPKYLAYKNTFLPLVILQLTLLIHRKTFGSKNMLNTLNNNPIAETYPQETM